MLIVQYAFAHRTVCFCIMLAEWLRVLALSIKSVFSSIYGDLKGLFSTYRLIVQYAFVYQLLVVRISYGQNADFLQDVPCFASTNFAGSYYPFFCWLKKQRAVSYKLPPLVLLCCNFCFFLRACTLFAGSSGFCFLCPGFKSCCLVWYSKHIKFYIEVYKCAVVCSL